MRKQELIHLHVLLVEVVRHLDERGEVPNDALDAYARTEARPTGIHHSKEKHHEAVRSLLSDIETVIPERPSESGIPASDGSDVPAPEGTDVSVSEESDISIP